MEKMKEKFKLIKPCIEYKEKAIEYIKEHQKMKSAINGAGGLNFYINKYEKWLRYLEKERKIIPNEKSVPTETFFFVRADDDKIIGMINIRLALNERIRNSYGNIGYGIRPTERRKGYNNINLYLALLECKKIGIKSVMISCMKDNLGSAKTIQHLLGNLEKEYFSKEYGGIIQIYWIDVDNAIENKKSEFYDYII